MERPPSAAEPVPRAGEFRVQLQQFEGPLDLLLHLIKKHELNILDLPVGFIAERYVEYLRVMRELDLEVAGEYLLMAATLTHIKSKMLLPRVPGEQQDEADAGGEEEDPRLELIRRLLEYQKYKAVAEDLGGRPVAGRDVFPRGMPGTDAQGPAPLAEIGLFKLLDAFQAILDRTHDKLALEVTPERISIQERMTQITDLLRERRSCQFEDLFAGDRSRYEIVVTFLALLEMTKMRVTRIFQTDVESPIHVHYALLDAAEPTMPPPAITSDQRSSEAFDEPRPEPEPLNDPQPEPPEPFDEPTPEPEPLNDPRPDPESLEQPNAAEPEPGEAPES
jgi:segregation and condensation protein A